MLQQMRLTCRSLNASGDKGDRQQTTIKLSEIGEIVTGIA
jgi:hypothetical protein